MTDNEQKQIPEEAKGEVQRLVANLTVAQQALNMYASGLKAGLGLNGDWNLDMQAMAFRPMKPPKEE
jgi:hypothetical protein